MIFGKIEYLNLLPFHIFTKRFLPSAQLKTSMHYYRGVPAHINKKFLKRKVDAAFISSINANKCKKPQLGIVAKQAVTSVLVLPHKPQKKDKESATSNVLADILQLQGEVLIGDKALAYYLQHNNYIDLAQEWYNKTKLPFVFAILCFHKKNAITTIIEKNFGKKPIKIPQYILKQAAKKSGIAPKDILEYLQLISYTLHKKEQQSLKIFLKKAKQKVK